MFSLSYSENLCSYYIAETFSTLEDAQYALDSLERAEEDHSTLQLRDAIDELREQIEAYITAQE